jgi:hypothetical protein
MNKKHIYLIEKIKKFLKIPTKCIICSHCIHGSQNFWMYWECWKTEKRMDVGSTKYTALRERYQRIRCINNTCASYTHPFNKTELA